MEGFNIVAKELYIKKGFSVVSLILIQQTNEIIESYTEQGFNLTLRQLYYQMIARDLFPESWIDEEYNLKNGLDKDTKNTVKNYNKYGDIVGDARLAGLIDWEAIEDRTRNLQTNGHWESPKQIVRTCASAFEIDKRSKEYQDYRIEVWIEKDALAGVIDGVCRELDVPYFACRGYNSLSEMWRASKRFESYIDEGQLPIILHLGDHDPSGIDMTRDIEDRLQMFLGYRNVGLEIDRLALNMNQIEVFNPPPNPAKVTDPRAKVYIKRFGKESWELDAMEPTTLVGLIRENIMQYTDENGWNEAVAVEEGMKEKLAEVALSL